MFVKVVLMLVVVCLVRSGGAAEECVGCGSQKFEVVVSPVKTGEPEQPAEDPAARPDLIKLITMLTKHVVKLNDKVETLEAGKTTRSELASKTVTPPSVQDNTTKSEVFPMFDLLQQSINDDKQTDFKRDFDALASSLQNSDFSKNLEGDLISSRQASFRDTVPRSGDNFNRYAATNFHTNKELEQRSRVTDFLHSLWKPPLKLLPEHKEISNDFGTIATNYPHYNYGQNTENPKPYNAYTNIQYNNNALQPFHDISHNDDSLLESGKQVVIELTMEVLKLIIHGDGRGLLKPVLKLPLVIVHGLVRGLSRSVHEGGLRLTVFKLFVPVLVVVAVDVMIMVVVWWMWDGTTIDNHNTVTDVKPYSVPMYSDPYRK